jgi:Flp pilus assembly protein TadB
MYHTRTGQFALIYAAASTCFGYWLMRKIVNIKLVRID